MKTNINVALSKISKTTGFIAAICLSLAVSCFGLVVFKNSLQELSKKHKQEYADVGKGPKIFVVGIGSDSKKEESLDNIAENEDQKEDLLDPKSVEASEKETEPQPKKTKSKSKK